MIAHQPQRKWLWAYFVFCAALNECVRFASCECVLCVRMTLHSIHQTSRWFTIKTQNAPNDYPAAVFYLWHKEPRIQGGRFIAVFINIHLEMHIYSHLDWLRRAYTFIRKLNANNTDRRPYALHIFNLVHQLSHFGRTSIFFMGFSSIWDSRCSLCSHSVRCRAMRCLHKIVQKREKKRENFIWMIAFVHIEIY